MFSSMSDLPWSFSCARTDDPRATRVTISENGEPITHLRMLELLSADARFASRYTAAILAKTQTPIRWETPPFSESSANSAAEFVLVESPSLDRPADHRPFHDQLNHCDSAIAVFSNLSGDATMIVPKPITPDAGYPHLVAFLRSAPRFQAIDLWREVGREMLHRKSAEPVWLSTAGMGVPWLHVRIDDRPKYYSFQPYRQQI